MLQEKKQDSIGSAMAGGSGGWRYTILYSRIKEGHWENNIWKFDQNLEQIFWICGGRGFHIPHSNSTCNYYSSFLWIVIAKSLRWHHAENVQEIARSSVSLGQSEDFGIKLLPFHLFSAESECSIRKFSRHGSGPRNGKKTKRKKERKFSLGIKTL